MTGRALDALAVELAQEHRACERAMRSTLAHAVRAGELLAEAKSQVPHGEWGRWLEDNFAGSARTAQTYMRVARGLTKAQAAADLTLEEAVARLARPRGDDQRLSAPEVEQLAECEARIETGLDRLRRNLRELHDLGAARVLGYATWEEFVVREFMPKAPAPAGDRELRATILALLLEPAGDERPVSR